MLSRSSAIEAVEAIFAKCSLVYGHEFLRRWDGLDLRDVKRDWAHELGRMPVEAIRYGLENLPERAPPNALQFRAICYGYRPPVAAALPDRVPRNPAFVRELVKGLKQKLALQKIGGER